MGLILVTDPQLEKYANLFCTNLRLPFSIQHYDKLNWGCKCILFSQTDWLECLFMGARWLSGRVSDSGARGRGFETYRRRVVSLSKTLYSPKVLVNYPGSGGSVPT